jgi:hypothetical protein
MSGERHGCARTYETVDPLADVRDDEACVYTSG